MPFALVLAFVALESQAFGARSLPPEAKTGRLGTMSLSVGAPNEGSQVRAKRLRASSSLAILERSKARVYGHPSLVLMLQRTAKQIAKSNRGARLVVGDLSHEHGGPLSGHHSHQSGRDADLVFYARDAKGKLVTPEKLVAYGPDGKATDGSGLVFDDALNWMLVESMARDARAELSYVFVSKPLRARLLAYAAKKKRPKKLVDRVSGLFLQPEHAEPHDDHFHVRVRCPSGQEAVCREVAR